MHRPPRHSLPLYTIETLNNHHLPHPHPPLIIPLMPPPLPGRPDSPTLHPPPPLIQNLRSHQIPFLHAPRVRHRQRRRPHLLDGPPHVEDLPPPAGADDGVGFEAREDVVETEEGAGVGLVDVRVVEGAAGGGVGCAEGVPVRVGVSVWDGDGDGERWGRGEVTRTPARDGLCGRMRGRGWRLCCGS